MASTNVIPLTVNSPLSTTWLSGVAMGTQSFGPPGNPTPAGYWILVIDRTALKVVYNQVQTSYDTAPDLGAFNTDDYFMIVAAIAVTLNNIPQGDFFTFLNANGAGPQLARLEQINTQLGCGTVGSFSYVLISILGLGQEALPGIEVSSIDNFNTKGVIVTASLIGTVVNGQTIYSPVILE